MVCRAHTFAFAFAFTHAHTNIFYRSWCIFAFAFGTKTAKCCQLAVD